MRNMLINQLDFSHSILRFVWDKLNTKVMKYSSTNVIQFKFCKTLLLYFGT